MDQFAVLRTVTNAGKLLSVDEVVFNGPPRLATGIILRFERRAVYVEAQADDGSLATTLTPPVPDTDHDVFQMADRGVPGPSC